MQAERSVDWTISGDRYRHTSLVEIRTDHVLTAIPSPSQAQWWTASAADFEEYAERAEKSGVAKDVKAARLAECDMKLAGRRKPSGGYTYQG